MTTINGELLSLYNSCRTLPIDQFQVALFDHLKALIPFDSARLIGVDMARGAAEVRCSILYREPETMPLHWEEISRLDTVLSTVAKSPGTACNYNARRLYSAPAAHIVLDYTNRFRHMNGLVVATTNEVPGYLEGLSLYRAHDESHFSRTEQHNIEVFAPHVQQALQINGALAQGAANEALPFAIINEAGTLNFCTPRLDELIRSEFPGWRGLHAPDELLRKLAANGSYTLRGSPICLTLHRFGKLLLMRAYQVEPSGLTPRESSVAMLFVQGNSHKEVARHLGIAPATVRNFLQRIYQKLDVHDKAALAVRLMGRPQNSGK